MKSSPPTETMIPQTTAIVVVQRWWIVGQRWGRQWGLYALLGTLFGMIAAIGVTQNTTPLQSAERQVQSRFWQWRGAIAPPDDIVIVGIDAKTLNQISSFPLDRGNYAQGIDKILAAGAKSIALDIILDVPRNQGQINPDWENDCEGKNLVPGDRALRSTLQRYGDRITLATTFSNMNEDGLNQIKLVVPYCGFLVPGLRLGNIDFKTENDTYYQLGNSFLKDLVQQSEGFQAQLSDYRIKPFAESALKAARSPIVDRPNAKYPDQDIFYYGGAETFTTISLADILIPENWQNRFQNGAFFRNKLVLLGATDRTIGDIKTTPLGLMPGVEVHANAIATIMQQRSLRPLLSNRALTGLLVFAAVLSAALLQASVKKPGWRLLWSLGLMSAWLGCSYGLMMQASLLLPTLLPIGAIGLTGLSYMGIGFARDQRNRSQLELSLQDRARDPVVRDIINQQNDEELKQKLLQGRQQELLGARIGGGRYKIIKIHSAGGFGETYIAEDLHRPDQPKCVVKKLSPASNNPKHLRLARRLFQREAETLEKLGKQHDQIPQLLAYFEEEAEFYLVQEFVDGHPLNREVALGRQLPETQIVAILREILQVLDFVHSQGVIHRDIKPSNLIRRDRDNRLVLIDFGAVKELQTAGEEESVSDLTIGIGTQGYMAPEQQAGHPQMNSDIYALGMMGVQMLTGVSPSQLTRDSETGEINLKGKTHASAGLIDVISKMITYHYKQRYKTAPEVLQDLKKLSLYTTLPAILNDLIQESTPVDEEVYETQPWPTSFEQVEDLPPTEPPPAL
jgi:CHASE2 domain-containing sensor protein/tRNA A-37 threonylcarbamoyl transferase component Bud32